MDNSLIAKYPFLSNAREFVGNKHDSTDLREAVAFAKECFERKEHLLGNAEREAKNLILSRLMLYSLGIVFLRKFAFFKAREYSRLLVEEKEGVLVSVAKDFFPSLSESEGGYGVSLVEYLEYGRNLPKAGLKQGSVFFDKAELADCLRTAIALRIADESKLSSKLPEDLQSAALQLKESIPREYAPAPRGKILQRAELQNILKGVSEGKRYYGAMAVAIACLKDGLQKEEALQVMQDYVSACAKGSHPFGVREGESVGEWVYRHPTINFSFQILKTQGLVG